MKKGVLLALIAIGLAASGVTRGGLAAENPARLMRRPDINGGKIVFSYEGDLWTVPEDGGTARRITVHMGVEDYPKFSPDGKWIAFCGDYNERRDQIFVIPADGGEPRQLTYHNSSAQPVAWTVDGRNVVFSSARESYVRFFKQFFQVPVDGGLPVEMGIGKGSFGSFSPDGTKMAYNRHPGRFWWWKRYKGSQNTDVWVHDFKSDGFKKLTDYEGNDSWPMWTGNSIYFVSDRVGDIANIFVIDSAGGGARQVTFFEEHGITWPSMSHDGKKIVFEREGGLYVLDTGSEKAKEVVIYIPCDTRENMTSYVDPLEHVRSFDISPSGKRIVFEARGEIFSAPAEYGDVRNLTNSSGSRDESPAWSPDGKYIAYISDKSGDDEIYLVDQMGKEPEKKLTSTGHFKRGIVWSPESDRILYSTEANELFMLGIDGSEPVLVNRNEHRDITTYHWSPDGKWVAYDFARRNRARDIFIYDVKKKEHHQITFSLSDETEPYFTPDGKYLLLISDRYRGSVALCRVSLLPEEEEPFVHKDDEETGNAGKDDDAENDDNGKEKDKKDKKKDKPVVKISFDGMEDRIRRVPKTGGRYMHNIQATDKYYYYLILSTRRMIFRRTYDLYAFNIEKLKSDKIATSIVTYGISADGKKIGIFDGSNFSIIKTGSKMSAKKADDDEDKGGELNIKRKTSMKLDREAEWRQIFNEGWRVVKYHFYDPNTHGVDWDGIKEYYSSLLPYVKTRRELNILMTEMVGELNASHQGVSGGDEKSAPRAPMAFLGAKISLDGEKGYPRFDRIFQSDNLSTRERSPLSEDFVQVKSGDYLLAIDGRPLEPGENFYQYLINKSRNKITITTNGKPSMKNAVETKFMPISQEITLLYKDWVNKGINYVDTASSGRIGYMHLQDMSGAGWTEFRERFDQYRYKDAIIIDVRYNGGGYIDTRVIDYLERRPYQLQRSRGESTVGRPEDTFEGEVVVLINEYSYSDAEVFPSAVKERGLGTLIGVPTLGFVIAVTPHYLIDGGTIRKTFIGIWEKESGKQLESRGAIPDIYVESPPEMEKAGRDVQLEKAVEFLMKKIGDKPRDFDYDLPIKER